MEMPWWGWLILACSGMLSVSWLATAAGVFWMMVRHECDQPPPPCEHAPVSDLRNHLRLLS
jgi:hypothetical protein